MEYKKIGDKVRLADKYIKNREAINVKERTHKEMSLKRDV